MSFSLQSKFLLLCSKWRTVFHFMTMVGADALHFGGLHNPANLTCLKHSARPGAAHSAPRGGNGFLALAPLFHKTGWHWQPSCLWRFAWLTEIVAAMTYKRPIDVRFELVKKSVLGRGESSANSCICSWWEDIQEHVVQSFRLWEIDSFMEELCISISAQVSSSLW